MEYDPYSQPTIIIHLSFRATILSFIVILTLVPFVLFTIRFTFNYMKNTKTFKKLVNKLTTLCVSKSDNIQKYGYLGLFSCSTFDTI